jgi:hypothetical protein
MMFIALSAVVLYALLPWLSKQLGTSTPAGFLGGLAAVLIVEWHGHGEYPAALVLALLIVWFVRRWTSQHSTFGGSFLLGIVIGISLHIQPALLPIFLACIGFELWWSNQPRKWAITGVIAFGVLLACIPWGWRNYTTFNSIFFVRSNLGLELRLGNHSGSTAAIAVMDMEEAKHLHPRAHYAEARRVKELGEIEYMRQARQEAIGWIRSNPAEFASLTLQRIGYFWAGPWYYPPEAFRVLALTLLAILGGVLCFPRLTIPQRAAFILPLVTFPLIYYVVAYMPRYRVPIDWILFILAGAGVWQAIGRISRTQRL